MPIYLFAILTGILLGVVGIVGFVTTGMTHYTALIPFALGDAIMMCGILTVVRPTWKKHTMHAAATIAVLGLLGSLRGAITLVSWIISHAEPQRPAAVIAQGLTAVICAIFIGVAIRSFIAARQARQQNSL